MIIVTFLYDHSLLLLLLLLVAMAGACHKPDWEPQLHINFICLTASEQQQQQQSGADTAHLTASPNAASTKPHLALFLLSLLFLV